MPALASATVAGAPFAISVGVFLENAIHRTTPRVRTRQLEIALQPHVGKNRRNMIGPVRLRGAQIAVAGQLALEQLAEREAGRVDVLVLALDEIHRHIERVVDIALKAHAVLESP